MPRKKKESPKETVTENTSPKKAKPLKPILTPEEAAIVSRIRAEDDTWKTVSEDEALDFSLAEDPFKLPEEAKRLQDEHKFRFRWIERTKERIDEIRTLDIPKRWWIVNAATIPELARLVDPVLGCITKLDQMLVFKPHWMFDAEQAMKTQMADTKDQSGRLEGKHGVPVDDSGSEFLAGKKYKIGRGDEVQFHETEEVAEDGTPVFDAGDDALGDLIDEG